MPLLLVTTLAIEAPTEEEEPRSLLDLSYWVAIGGALSALLVALFLASAGRRALGVPPRGWLLGIALASLLYNGMEVLGRSLGCSSHPRTSAWLRTTSSWALGAMRAQLAVLAMLMAHQACPERARRALLPSGMARLRRWQLGGAAAACVLPALQTK